MSGRPAQKKLLTMLLDKPAYTRSELRAAQISADTVERLKTAGIVDITEEQSYRDSYAHTDGQGGTVAHTDDQLTAIAAIKPALAEETYHSFLLHGITGSGKTEIYLTAAAQARAQARQVIVLVPEIALTGQTVARFKQRFTSDVVVIHSKLSIAERFDTWERIRLGEAGIIIGARSAIFAPTPKLGLVIIDEEHELTYKQEEQPRYHAREVSIKRAALAGATVILGSATPSPETYYNAERGIHTLLTLPSRVEKSVLPTVLPVDMRDELMQGRRGVLSESLRELLTATLDKKEQAIIVLNRRGYSTFVMCRECGHVIKCDHCSVAMVYHARGKTLGCHYCGQKAPIPDTCPACESRYIKYFGTGTQKVEEELRREFPAARVLRVDQDTTRGKTSIHTMLAEFADGKHDILLGTQMVAKGHDFKNVTAVGILAADSALNIPDFRAAERTFNLLTQAAGRAGRGDIPGKVVVQSYNPTHYAVACGARHDYSEFYRQEMEYRRELSYPPLQHLIKITVSESAEEKAAHNAENLATILREMILPYPDITILGPSPAAIIKVKDMYRVLIIIKAPDPRKIKQLINEAGLWQKQGVIFDVDPVNTV